MNFDDLGLEPVSVIIPEKLYQGGEKAICSLDRAPSLHIMTAHGVFTLDSEVIEAFMVDAPWDWRADLDDVESLHDLARTAAAEIRGGGDVLVTCFAGLNRSGIVTALTLCALGFDPHDAIRLIRQRRGPMALHNKSFVDCILKTGGSLQP